MHPLPDTRMGSYGYMTTPTTQDDDDDDANNNIKTRRNKFVTGRSGKDNKSQLQSQSQLLLPSSLPPPLL